MKKMLFEKPSAQIIIIVLLGGMLLAAPFGKFILPFVVLGAALAAILYGHPEQRKFLVRWMLAALAARLLFLAIVQFAPVTREPFPFFFLDDQSYHRWSKQIAQRWHQGEMPRVWTDAEVGTLQTGYYYFISGIYYVMGANPVFPLLLNSLFGSLLCLLVFRLAELLLDDRAARWSMILCAVNPVFWFWSSFLLKDTLLAVFFVLALVLYIEWRRKRNLIIFAALLPTAYFLFLIRVPSLMVVLAAIFIYELLESPRKGLLLALAGAGAALAVAGRAINLARDVEDQIIYSFLNALPDAGLTYRGALKYLARGVPRLFLAPYGWVFAHYFTPFYFLYIGQWFFYLYLFPHALAGCIRLISENKRTALWLIIPVVIKCYLYLLTELSARHMLELMPLFTVAAAYALRRPLTQRFMFLYYISLVAFMLLHLLTLVL